MLLVSGDGSWGAARGGGRRWGGGWRLSPGSTPVRGGKTTSVSGEPVVT
jgi:hypothetical protein